MLSRPLRLVRCVVLVTSMAWLTGCYRYVRVEPEAVPAGAMVRGYVTPSEAANIEEATGRRGRIVDGELVRSNPDTFFIAVPLPRQATAVSGEPLHQLMALPRSHVLELQLRQPDRVKTAALIALGTVGLAVALYSSVGGKGGGQTPPPGGGPAESRGLPGSPLPE